MTRFKDRPLEWIDVNPRFEALSSSDHARNAIAFIQVLEIEGAKLLAEGSNQHGRWKEGCAELQGYIRALGQVDDRDGVFATTSDLDVLEPFGKVVTF